MILATRAQFDSVRYCLAFFFMMLLAGCAATSPSSFADKPSVIYGEQYVIHIAESGDTWVQLAETYLNDRSKDWMIADFNNGNEILPGQQIVIPRIHPNPVGVYSSGYQTITILCYHRFGSNKSKMVMTAEDFDGQMTYLKNNGYHVISLSSIHSFFKGESPLPRRAVAITIDDGYRSSYDIAYPILKKHKFPATLFVYSDFIGSGDALRWNEMKEMVSSGLIDIQPHSKTHVSLAKRLPSENADNYLKRIEEEIRVPAQQIKKILRRPLHTFAYPFGDTSEFLISRLKSANYSAGVTVNPGGNPAFSYPFKLRRTMIYGDRDMITFIGNLKVFTPENLK